MTFPTRLPPVVSLDDELRYPGHGLPPRRTDMLPALEAWARLSQSQALGKKVNLFYDPDVEVAQSSEVEILRIEGNDRDACQIQIALDRPYAIPRRAAELGLATQNATGELDNVGMARFGDYPGTSAPITWPPFVAVVEWGVGGHKSRAYVDFVQGATINVTASYLQVHAAVPPDAINVPGTKGMYTLAGFAGPGYARDSGCQRTIYLGSVLDENSSGVFAVPPFAKRVTLVSFDDSIPPVLTTGYIQFWQDVGATRNVGNFYQAGNSPIPFQIPGAANYVTVFNQMGLTEAFTLVFDLAI